MPSRNQGVNQIRANYFTGTLLPLYTIVSRMKHANGSDTPASNPLLQYDQLPAFDQIAPEHAGPAIKAILTTAREQFKVLESAPGESWETLMVPLYELERPLEFAWGTISHMLSVMNSPTWREAHEALQPEVIAFSLELAQSRPLFDAMQALRAADDYTALSTPRQRVLESSLRAATQAGVGLPPEKQERFNAIKAELAKLGTNFTNHLLDATKAYELILTTPDQVSGLPETLLRATAHAATEHGHPDATAEHGPWRLSLDQPIYVPFMQYAESRTLREQLYRAFVTRASTGELDNAPLITDMLALRREQANLLDFDTYADLSLSRKMAPDVTAAQVLLETLRDAAQPPALAEQANLEAFAEAHGVDAPLLQWDVGYWAEQMRKEQFAFTAEDLRPYFQFPMVLEGLFALAATLFGIRIEPADGDASVWHEDVRLFRVFDEENNETALFYLDPYVRPETKSGGAWMNSLRPRTRDEAGPLQVPVAYLVCNQTRPDGDTPSLMTHNEVETLFHEFGHALQHMLTRVEEPGASGIYNIEWDAVELASQFMENWCYDWATLQGLSKHITTGESIPRDLFDKITRARTFRAGAAMMRQLLFSTLDLELHHAYLPGDDDTPRRAKERIAAAYSVLPLLPEDRFLCGFAHIFAGGYAAGYYSYKWSEVLSADPFAAFEEAGIDNPEALQETGKRYRDTVLALGGGTHPMEVFEAFRGRKPSPTPLLAHNGLLA